MLKIFGLTILPTTALAALSQAGHEVEHVAISAGDHLALALKRTAVGAAIAAAIADVKDAALSGPEKMEKVVADVLPTAVSFFSTGGVAAAEQEVSDAVRATAQLLYNDLQSTSVGKLVADAAHLLGLA